MFHYTYLLIDTNIAECQDLNIPFLYCGMRTAKTLPDLKYISSSKYIKNALKNGRNFNKVILDYFETRELALLYEAVIVDKEWIASPNTYNICLGGIGSNDFQFSKISHNKKKFYDLGGKPWNKGLKYSKEERQRLTELINSNWAQNKNEYFQWKENIANSIKSLWKNIDYVKKHRNLEYLQTEEVAQKRNNSLINFWDSEEEKIKASNRTKILWQNDEYRNKQRNLEYLHNEEIAKKISKSSSEYWNSEEGKAKASAKTLAKWQDEDYRKNNDLSYLRTDEVKEKLRKAAKAQFSKPLVCPHCKTEGKGPWMYQKHFKNCKMLNIG